MKKIPLWQRKRQEKEALQQLQKIAELQKDTEDPQQALRDTVEELTRVMEKTRIAEYVAYLDRPWKLLWNNFLIGIARGLGSTVGLAIVLAILFFVVQKIIVLNLPWLSDFIAKAVYSIQENLDRLYTTH